MRGSWTRMQGKVAWKAAEQGREKLSCVTAIPVDSWSALLHISPYCSLGGLRGRKQVSAQFSSV